MLFNIHLLLKSKGFQLKKDVSNALNNIQYLQLEPVGGDHKFGFLLRLSEIDSTKRHNLNK